MSRTYYVNSFIKNAHTLGQPSVLRILTALISKHLG